jgi:hypothetical protein
MSEISTVGPRDVGASTGFVQAEAAIARAKQRMSIAAALPRTIDQAPIVANQEIPGLVDPTEDSAKVMRWIPLVVPLLGALMALNTYVIFWVVDTLH